MKKKISKKEAEERKIRLREFKKQRLILDLATIPPICFTILFIVFYAIKKTVAWIPAVASGLWFIVGGLFIFAMRKKWGFVTRSGAKSDNNATIATIYNVILIFFLAVFFLAVTIKKLI